MHVCYQCGANIICYRAAARVSHCGPCNPPVDNPFSKLWATCSYEQREQKSPAYAVQHVSSLCHLLLPAPALHLAWAYAHTLAPLPKLVGCMPSTQHMYLRRPASSMFWSQTAHSALVIFNTIWLIMPCHLPWASTQARFASNGTTSVKLGTALTI